MKIVIKTPSIAYLHNYTQQELSELNKQFAYKNGKIENELIRHRQKSWLKRKDPDQFEHITNELKSQMYTSTLYYDGTSYYIRPASIPYIQNITFSIENHVKYPALKPRPWIVDPEFEPYEYQSNSVSNLLNIGHGNICLPTGCGKSFILLMLAQQLGTGVVVVTPSKSIFSELYSEFQLRLGKNAVGGYGDGKKDLKKPITIAIGRSLTMIKEGSEAEKFFKNKTAVLVDESHTWGADTLESVCHGLLSEAPYRFFVSATQTRGDGGVKLLQSIIGETVLEMSLQEAIEKKFLCPLKFGILDVISPSTKNKKDPIECKREHFLYNKNIAQVAARIANASWKVNQESTLILVEELIQIQMLTELLDVPYTYVHAASKKDAAEYGLEKVKLTEEIEKFNNGEVKVIIGTRAIATGTNLYPTHNTINWMGGSSEIITKQGPMGRSTRWIKNKYKPFHKEKKFTKVWDFNVRQQSMLKNMLNKRIEYYKETGVEINSI